MCAVHAWRHDPTSRDKRFFRFAPSQSLETCADIQLLLWILEFLVPGSPVESLRQKRLWNRALPIRELHCYSDLKPGRIQNSASRRDHCVHRVLLELPALPPPARSAYIGDRSEYPPRPEPELQLRRSAR